MKVLHLLRKQAQLNSTFIRNQIEGGIQVSCVVAFYENAVSHSLEMLKRTDDNSIIEIVPLNVRPNIFCRWYYKLTRKIDPIAQRTLMDLIVRIKPDVIHLHYGTDAGIFLPAMDAIDLPKFVSFYGYDAFSFPKKFWGLGKLFLQRRVFARASMILPMSQVMKEDVKMIGCEEAKIHIHYHGVPSLLSVIKRSDKSNEVIQLMMLSYLDPVKGHLFVLKALKTLINIGKQNFHLNIYGDGHYRMNIEAAIAELNLQDFVTMHGKVSYLSDDYFKAFETADVFLHPSVMTKDDKEGIPGALVEAMFSALPSIATLHGGIPCVIMNGQSGILIRENDIQELANAIETLMADESMRHRMGQQARLFALDQLDIKKRQLSLEMLYSHYC